MSGSRSSARVGFMQPLAYFNHITQLKSHEHFLSAIGVIRLIKMFGYEGNSSEKIAEKREKELDNFKRKIMLNIVTGIYK